MVRASGKKGGSILPRASASHVVPIVEFDPSSRIARDLCDHRVSRRLGPAGDSEEDQPKLRVLARNCHGTAPGTRAVTPASPFASSMKGLSKRFPSNPLARRSRRASELPGVPRDGGSNTYRLVAKQHHQQDAALPAIVKRSCRGFIRLRLGWQGPSIDFYGDATNIVWSWLYLIATVGSVALQNGGS